jgi:DNA primase
LIPRDTVDKIIDAARVEEVLGEFITLKKRGANLLGLCPFHGEKTPSFTVSPVKGIYKCFGCGKAGNSVNFIMDHLNLSYPEALKWLANKYGIEVVEKEITPEEKEQLNERESMLIVMQYAARYFQDTMNQTDEGKSIGLGYFLERGLRNDIIEKFQLGYSLEDRRGFTNAAVKAGYLPKYLAKTGMSILSNSYVEGNEIQVNDVFDRYAGRVMFPIQDEGGRVVAFGGRTLSNDKKVAKYINSPETDIYHKSKVLYGLWLGKKAIQQKNTCYLVEGYMDVIAMHQAGIENVVASSGTSLTIEQIKAVHRFTNNIVVLYDGDAAGQKASDRAIPLLLEEGMNVKVLLFPDNHDPDSYSRLVSADDFSNYLESNAQDFLIFKAHKLSAETKNDPIKKATVIKDLVANIALIPDTITRTIYVKECANIMEMEEPILQVEVNKLRRKSTDKQKRPDEETPSQLPPELTENLEQKGPSTEALKLHHEESELLRLMMNYGNIVVGVEHKDLNNETYIQPLTIDEYVVFELLRDEIEFEDPINQLILDEFKHELQNHRLPLLNYFIQHPNPAISTFAINNAQINYSLSDKWGKFGVLVTDEKNEVKKSAEHVLYSLKDKRLNKHIMEMKESLKTLAFEDVLKVQERIMYLEQEKKNLNKILGRIIIK